VTSKQPICAWLAAALLLTVLGYAGAAGAQGGSADRAAHPSDAAITARVQTAIRKAPALEKMDIRVETRGGIVHLSGFVDSMDDIARAAAVAGSVEGVSAVRNALRVANRPSRG
jgi:osmotically-inducible protein OsmY